MMGRRYVCAIILLRQTILIALISASQFEVRICPALKDKRKSKEEVLAKVGVKLDQEDKCEKSSPFEPPYVEELHVGELEGIDGEEGMAVLVRPQTPLRRFGTVMRTDVDRRMLGVVEQGMHGFSKVLEVRLTVLGWC
jgi:hypothetical protein